MFSFLPHRAMATRRALSLHYLVGQSICRRSVCTSISMPTFDVDYSGIKVVCSDPPVFVIDDFLSNESCEDLKRQAIESTDKLEVSRTFLMTKNGVPAAEIVPSSSSVRNSSTYYIDAARIEGICSRISELTGYPTSTFEEPQVVRYKVGQHYKWHQDAVPTARVNPIAGNRLATVLVYLNTLPEDTVDHSGYTSFKHLALHVRPEKGKCLVFFPCFRDGTPDARTAHCSNVITQEGVEKWALQVWVHQRPYL